MNQQPLVSIVMAAYNAERYISEAIESVLAQTHARWELLIVNDGSTDQTKAKIQAYDDARIRYFEQANGGVSAARNVAFAAMNGDFFLIFDSDDVLPPHSLEVRLAVFAQNPDVYFVDGVVVRTRAPRQSEQDRRVPSFEGNPHTALMQLDMRCFSVPAWLIRRDHNQSYQMEIGMTHGEDLLFYIHISQNPKHLYTFVQQEILYYRLHDTMAMRNLEKLERGYVRLFHKIKYNYPRATFGIRTYLKWRIVRIMLLSFWRNVGIWAGLRSVGRLIWLR